MTTLYPKQKDHALILYRALLNNGSALDTSQTGTGKTIVASHIANHLKSRGVRVGVVCPKIVVTNWERTLKAHDVEPVFVANYEKLRNGLDGVVRVKRKRRTGSKSYKWFEWQVPKDTLLIFDEVQWCKGHATQNSNLLIAAKQQGIMNLNLSATAAKDPTEMRALGYALGLHDLNDLHNNRSYQHWLRDVGCSKDPWGKWTVKKNADLTELRRELFEERQIAHGLQTSDMPGAFQNQRIITDLGDYAGAKEIFEQAGLNKEVVDVLVAGLEKKAKLSTTIVTDILRARQRVEALKVSSFVEQANEFINEGKSVVAFFNFRDSLDTFRAAFPESGIIVGQQKDRQQQIDNWAADRTRVIAVSSSAGGSGVDLHDVRGEFPRATIISPGFSVHTYKQVLGRAYRVGMKTDLIQKVMVAANTIEEYVHEKCMEGVRNMEDMLGS